MSCENVQQLISPLVDRATSAGEREKVLAHIRSCAKCGAHLEAIEHQRTLLRGMSQPPVPPDLSAKLRVMASHEHARRTARASLGARWQDWSSAARLWFDNLMRPVALPVAGGLLSALAMFAILVPTLSFNHNLFDQAFFTYPDGEVVALGPTGTYSPTSLGAGFGNNPWIVRADVVTPPDANVVWLTIDENGKVSDFSVERGQLTPELQSIIMFSQFTPATVLGLPTSAKVKAVQFSPLHSPAAPRSMRS